MPSTETRETEIERTEPEVNGVRHERIHRVEESGPSGSTLAIRIMYWVLGVVETLLAIRFVLALLGANRDNAFAQLIFNLSAPFAQPFFGLFGYEPTYGVSHVELGTLVAMAVYALVVAGIAALIRLPRHSHEA